MAKRRTPKTLRKLTAKKKKAGQKKAVESIVIKVKPLPEALLERLKKAAPAIEKNLGRMENIDHRSEMKLTSEGWPKIHPKNNISEYGRRVRQMNLARNFPGVELAIKRSHGLYKTAAEEIETIKLKVTNHNKKFKPRGYVLLQPLAYAISDRLIAMPKINAPSVREILDNKQSTPRGRGFFSQLSKKFGLSESDLRKHRWDIRDRAGIRWSNLWLLGFKEGKFVFMAMPDWW